MYAAGNIRAQRSRRVSAFTDGIDILEVFIKRPLPPEGGSPDFENSDELRMNAKIPWYGAVTAVQPRIRLTRSFDERSHTYLGYLLRIEGTVGRVSAEFRVGIGAGTHAKHQLRIGDHVEGLGHRVADSRLEAADIYKVSKLKLMRRGEELATTAPWNGVPPPLPSIASADIDAWRWRPTIPGVIAASGAVPCLWR